MLSLFVLALSGKSLHSLWEDCHHHHSEIFSLIDANNDDLTPKLSITTNFEECNLCKFTFYKSMEATSLIGQLPAPIYSQFFISPFQHFRTQSEVANQSLRGPPKYMTNTMAHYLI